MITTHSISLAFRCAVIAFASFILCNLASSQAAPVQFYFDRTVATGGDAIGGFAITPDGNTIWSGSYGSQGQIRKVTYNGSTWVPTINVVTQSSWANYIVADGTQTSATPNLNTWSSAQGFLGAMALNPAPITLGTVTYAPGTLMLMNQFGANLNDGVTPVANRTYDAVNTKRLYWYNMTQTGQPLPATGSSTAPGPRTDYDGDNISDWNDQFSTILTQGDFNTFASNSSNTQTTNQGRAWAFSSDGQSIYQNDTSSTFGGIYKIDLTKTGPAAIQRVISNTNLAVNEVTVINTADRDFGFGSAGDQLLMLADSQSATFNRNGINAYLDDGTTFHDATPVAVFSEAQFREFADWGGTTAFRSLTTDGTGTLYAFETQSNMLFRFDSEGRFAKVVSEEERKAFIKSTGMNVGTSVLELKTRTNTTANAFPVTEVLYEDATAATILGMLDYKTGDFDYDNDVDATDKAAFLAALRGRGVANPGLQNHKFNLNGNSSASTGNATNTTSNPNAVANLVIADSIIDWKDVKILQTFLDFPDGDTNLDGVLDITDLNIMRDNYYTLSGATDKTWAQGDFASLDPHSDIYGQWVADDPTKPDTTTYHFVLPSDNGLVNLVDLQLLADTWKSHPEFAQLTWADLALNGYTGQFRLDVIAAFNLLEPSAAAVPEPNTCTLLLLGAGFLARRRRSHRQALAARRIDQ